MTELRFEFSSIDEQVAEVVRTELSEDEKLLWADKPHALPAYPLVLAGFIFLLIGFFIVPMGYALWSGDMTMFDSYKLTINGQRVSSESPVSTLRIPFLMMIIALIIYIAILSFWAWVKRREIYGLTDKRAIILSLFPWKRVVSIAPAAMSVIERNGNGAIGSVVFRASQGTASEKVMGLSGAHPHSFTKIRNPKVVTTPICERFLNKLTEEEPP